MTGPRIAPPRPDNGRVRLIADYAPQSTVIRCAECPSWAVVRSTRDAAWLEAHRHAATVHHDTRGVAHARRRHKA